MAMKFVLRKVHSYVYFFSVAFIYFLLWPLFYFFSRYAARYRQLNKLRRIWALTGSAMAGLFYSFEYEGPVDWSKTYIICPNHTSLLDIGAMCIMVKSDYSFMGKEELKQGLVTRLFFGTVDIPVNRDSKISSYRAFKKAAQNLQNGTSMILFPEGGIADEYPPALQEFKNGPFRLAIELKIPIIPVSSSNTWKMLWDDGAKYGTRPGICNYFVHAPVKTDQLTLADAGALRDKVFNIIARKLHPEI
jgi:1-acyl-sn-glycerol-3-phosphate acyltransferase